MRVWEASRKVAGFSEEDWNATNLSQKANQTLELKGKDAKKAKAEQATYDTGMTKTA